ncbi:MAG: PD-(D/E)XK nuclease family protein [Candidatus Nanoarchaeia archaeon]|nr:PD-(D/E)XK nuclease family protein [Candidatus Nanoarchaeia archaeon]
MKKNGIMYISPSSLNLYTVCPMLYKHKDIKIQDKNDNLNFGSFIHDVVESYFEYQQKRDILKIAKSIFTEYNISLEQYLDAQNVLKRFLERDYLKYKVLDYEKEFQNILSNGVALRGRVDLIVERDNETIEVIDYKSGWKFYTLAMINKNVQLKIYENLILHDKKYKKYKNIVLTIDPLRYEPKTVLNTDLNNDAFLEWIESVYLKILKDRVCSPNFPCSFCKNCYITNLCDGYKHLEKYDFKIKQNPSDKVSHFLKLQSIKQVVEGNLDFYKDYFKNEITKQKVKHIKIDNYLICYENNKIFVREA